MVRLRSRSGRVVLALLAAVLFQLVYAGWHWDVRHRSGKGLFALSPTGRIIRTEATMAVVLNWVHEGMAVRMPSRLGLILSLAFVVVAALPAACIGLFVFILLTNRWGPPDIRDPESRCRKCGYILKGLSATNCPECGEAI